MNIQLHNCPTCKRSYWTIKQFKAHSCAPKKKRTRKTPDSILAEWVAINPSPPNCPWSDLERLVMACKS